MKKCVVSVFPGQGSQFTGMGIELFKKYEYHTRLAEQTLGYSLTKLCEGDFGQLSETQFTQPALFVVNILQYLDDTENQAGTPDILAGHSLGEYCALFAAGAFSFATALKIVQERGRLLASCKSGTMAAVLGLPRAEVETLIRKSSLSSLSISNINAPTQHVISGDRDEVPLLEPLVVNAGGSFYPLNVSGAFHSGRMQDIANSFRTFLSKVQVFPLKIPVLSNVTAEPYPMSRPEQVIDLLVRQLYSPVLWQQCMERIPGSNVIMFREHGPKNVLTNLARQILSDRQLVFPNDIKEVGARSSQARSSSANMQT